VTLVPLAHEHHDDLAAAAADGDAWRQCTSHTSNGITITVDTIWRSAP
jgi:hypothetical protein